MTKEDKLNDLEIRALSLVSLMKILERDIRDFVDRYDPGNGKYKHLLEAFKEKGSG